MSGVSLMLLIGTVFNFLGIRPQSTFSNILSRLATNAKLDEPLNVLSLFLPALFVHLHYSSAFVCLPRDGAGYFAMIYRSGVLSY